MEITVKEGPHKLFISHSSYDRTYVLAFVELLEKIGMPDGSIVCTLVPGYGVPGGANIYEWLREQFVSYDLRVVFMLSHNYYDSVPCLNEMGAAWITKAKDTIILLPGFSYSDMKGCIDSRKLGIRLDGPKEELKFRIKEFLGTIVQEYNLSPLSQEEYEQYSDSFIKKIEELDRIIIKEVDIRDNTKPSLPQQFNSPMTNESNVMLVYAAAGDGQIVVSRTLSGTSFLAGGKTIMNVSQEPREIAKWDAAVNSLYSSGYIKAINSTKHTDIYQVTQNGLNMSDGLREIHGINTDKTPAEAITDLLNSFIRQQEDQDSINQEIADYISYNGSINSGYLG